MSNFFPELWELPWVPCRAECVIVHLLCPSTASCADPLYGLTIKQNVIASDAAISAQALWALWNNKW